MGAVVVVVAGAVEVVVTDWAEVHLGWASTFPAYYTVPTDNAVETLLSVGIPPMMVHRSGFLVREQFASVEHGPAAQWRARERLGLPEDRFLFAEPRSPMMRANPLHWTAAAERLP